MKLLDVLLLSLCAGLISLALTRWPPALRRRSRGVMLVVVALTAATLEAFTPTERDFVLSTGGPLSVQFIVLPEADEAAYKTGLVATPRALPLVSVNGELFAKSDPLARVLLEWRDGALRVTSRSSEGLAVPWLCGNASVHGIPVLYDPPAAARCEAK